MRPAAAARVEAMDLSDAWVEAGCRADDPLLAQERAALVASYTALRDAVGVQPQHPVVVAVGLTAAVAVAGGDPERPSGPATTLRSRP